LAWLDRISGKTALAIGALLALAGWTALRSGWLHRNGTHREVQAADPKRVVDLALNAEVAFEPELRHLSVAGRARSFLVLIPKARKAGLSLVFSLHGDGGDGVSYHQHAPFEPATNGEAVVVYPTGVGTTWDIDESMGTHDFEFIAAIAEQLTREFDIDRKRIFGSGYSRGAYLLNFMACERPGLFRALASNAGSAPYQRAESYPNGYTKCPAQKPIPFLALHGTADYSVTLQSGRFSADYWAYVNGCNVQEWESTILPECRAFVGCPKGLEVAYCEVPGLGHWVWEDHARVSWAFFKKHMD
jgi:polyhydroxybutyrate depolymerase